MSDKLLLQKTEIILQLSDSKYADFQVSITKEILLQNNTETLISHTLEQLEHFVNHCPIALQRIYDKTWHIHGDTNGDCKTIYICAHPY